MSRREFISVMAGAAVSPLRARAERPAMPVIGFLGGTEVPLFSAAFRRGLAEAGYVEGKNLAIEYRFTNLKPGVMPEAAGDLVRLKVNVIFAQNPDAVAEVRKATNSIPIVAFDLESDPIAKGFVRSIPRPGGNITGMFLDIPELCGKQAGLLKEIVPRLSRIAIFGIPGLNAAQFGIQQEEAEVRRLETALDFSRTEFQRAQALSRTQTISAQAFDKAKFDVATIEAALASAKAQIDVRRGLRASLAARLIDPSSAQPSGDPICCVQIRAPVTGRVLKIIQESEAVVQTGTPLIEIGDPADLEVVRSAAPDLATDTARNIRQAPSSRRASARWSDKAILRTRRLSLPRKVTRM